MMLRVVLLTSAEPGAVVKLLDRLGREVDGAAVAGVLYEQRPQKPLARRVVGFLRGLGDPDFLDYAAMRLAASARRRLASIGHAALHLVHGAPRLDQTAPADLAAACAARGVALHVTADIHDPAALTFAARLEPDLGVVYGTRVLRPVLFGIPRLGSINLHKRRVPDYRGGGPVGLWEMLDGGSEIGVTVHEVEASVDTGAVVQEATIRIDPYDTLESLAAKAHVVGNDLVVRAVADYARGTVERRPQGSGGRTYRAPRPARLRRLTRELERGHPRYRAPRSRRLHRLLGKSALALPRVMARNWLRRVRGAFPVLILFHHLVSDRPHRLGMSTEQFLRHIDFLRRHYRIVSLAEATHLLRTGRVDAPTVVLTFDDGYGDNYLTLRAAAELSGVPMTLFVSTTHITEHTAFAHDLGMEPHVFLPLTWAELKHMRREGFEIGGHTRTHFDCGTHDLARLTDEIAGCKADLDRHLRAPAPYFAFPFGLPENISPEAMELASGGFAYVLSAYGGDNFVADTGKHLKRWGHPADLWELELILQGVLERERPPVNWPDSVAAELRAAS